MSFTETTGAVGVTPERRSDYTTTTRQTPQKKRKTASTTKDTKDTKMAKSSSSKSSPMPRRMTQQAGDGQMKKDAGAKVAAKGNINMTSTDGIVPAQRATGAPQQNVYPGFTGNGKTKAERTHGTHPHIPKAAGTRCQ